MGAVKAVTTDSAPSHRPAIDSPHPPKQKPHSASFLDLIQRPSVSPQHKAGRSSLLVDLSRIICDCALLALHS